MLFRLTRRTGFALGLLLGTLWFALNFAVATRCGAVPLPRSEYLHVVISSLVPPALAIFGCALGFLSQRAQDHARQLAELKDEFIASAAHELRTPLTVIRTLAQLGLDDARRGLAAEAAASLEDIVSQVDRTAHLVDQLLDASRLDAGRLALQLQPVELPVLLLRELVRLRPVYASHALLWKSPPSGRPAQTILLDPEKVLQVVDNLIANAVKYSPVGSTVTLGVADAPGGAEVWVTDQGPGIPPADREAIFTKFHRASAAVQSGHAGLGLGLYISRRLVELHGGRLWLDRSSEAGSTFRFFLPTAGPPGAAPPSAKS